MKKILSILISAAMVLALASCGAPSQLPENDTQAPDAVLSEADIQTPETDTEETEDGDGASEIEHAEVVRLAQFVSTNFEYQGCKQEDISGYSFSGYEHKPIAAYTMHINEDGLLYIRIYESPEIAADEAGNYGSDGSEYSTKNNVADEDGNVLEAMIIDYISPVHFWLSGDAIIQYNSWDDSSAAVLDSFYGGQFAGGVISNIPDGELEFTYTDYNHGIAWDGVEPDYFSPAIITKYEWFQNFAWNLNEEFSAALSDDVLELYDEDFFDAHTLVAIPLPESSVSDRHIVESVFKDGNTLTVNITNYDTGDEALDFCLMFLELDGKLATYTEIALNRQQIFGLYPSEP